MGNVNKVRKVEPVNDIDDFKSDHMDSKNAPNEMIKVMDVNGEVKEVPRSEIKTFDEYFNSEMGKLKPEELKEGLGNLIPGYIKSDFSEEQLAGWGFASDGNPVILDGVYPVNQDSNHSCDGIWFNQSTPVPDIIRTNPVYSALAGPYSMRCGVNPDYNNFINKFGCQGKVIKKDEQ